MVDRRVVACIVLLLLSLSGYGGYIVINFLTSSVDSGDSVSSGDSGGDSGGSLDNNYIDFVNVLKSKYKSQSKTEICDKDKCFPCKTDKDCSAGGVQGDCVRTDDLIYGSKFGKVDECTGCGKYGVDKVCKCPYGNSLYIPSPSPFYDPEINYFRDFSNGRCVPNINTTVEEENDLTHEKCNLINLISELHDTNLLTMETSTPYLFENNGTINILEHYDFKNQYELNVPIIQLGGTPYNYKTFENRQNDIFKYTCEGSPVKTGIDLGDLDTNYYCKIGDISKIAPKTSQDVFSWNSYNEKRLNLNITSPNVSEINSGFPTEMGWNILYGENGIPINNYEDFIENYKCNEKDMIQKSTASPTCDPLNGITLPIDCVNRCSAPFEIPSSPSVTISSPDEFRQLLNSETGDHLRLVTSEMESLITYGDYFPNDVQEIECSYNNITMSNEYNWSPVLEKIEDCATYKKSKGDNSVLEFDNTACSGKDHCETRGGT